MNFITQAKSRPAAILCLGIALGAGSSMAVSAWADRSTIPWQEARLFAEVFERVKAAYVDEVVDRQLAESAATGMMSHLDAYSAYLDPQAYEDLRTSTAGAYAGVGVEISLDDGNVKVKSAMDDSPAVRAGLLAGDIIVAVDDIPVDPEHLAESVNRIRGKAGTRVKLTVNRLAHNKPVQIVVTRGTVQVHSVKRQELESGYGYVRISQFSDTTAAEFVAALTALQNDAGQSLRGLVLDLRDNPGGVLEAATQVTDAMLDKGVIVTADGRTAYASFEIKAELGDLLNGAPIAVLVNGSSASAAEIVAGALQDHKRGLLIGQSTYGKGSVQTVMPLSDGGALKLTTSRYHTPSGASIQQRGIAPNIVSGRDVPPAAANAVALLKEDSEVRLALATLKRQPALNLSAK